MKLKELETSHIAHLIESASVNNEFREGLKALNSKMNWVLTLISGAALVILAVVVRH